MFVGRIRKPMLSLSGLRVTGRCGLNGMLSVLRHLLMIQLFAVVGLSVVHADGVVGISKTHLDVR